MDEIEEVVEGIFRFAGITVRMFCKIFADAKWPSVMISLCFIDKLIMVPRTKFILIKSITESVFIIDKKISFAFANHHLFQPGKKMLDR